MRKVADALLDPKLSHMMLPTSNSDGDPAINASGDSENAESSSAIAAAVNSTPVLSARQQAALLYALAGDQGDSESLLQLGWMLYYGEQGNYFTLLRLNVLCCGRRHQFNRNACMYFKYFDLFFDVDFQPQV